MTPSIDQTLHLFANLLPNWTFIPILTLLPSFGGFHRTLQRLRLANRGRLFLRKPGPVPFGTCICSNVETVLSWACRVCGPFGFRASLGASVFIKTIADVLKRRIRRLKRSVNTRHESIFCDPEVVRELSRLHENFVIVPADKASNNYTFVCRKYYVSILIEELGLNSLPGNPTYNLTDFSASEVLNNHKSVLTSFGIHPNKDKLDLPYIYWIPKMHKIHINIDSLLVRPGAPSSFYPFFLQSCLHILSKVFRSTAKQPIV